MKYDRKYDDIINLPHHVSKKHPQMSLYARSAQFAPFAALTGYEDAVKETAREVSQKIELDEDLKLILDSKLHILMELADKNPELTVTYFVKDLKKEGGKYVTVTGVLKKLDSIKKLIYLKNGNEISIDEIIDISIQKN